MREKIIELISEHPNIDTRIIIDAFSIALDIPKQVISGHLSYLVQNKEIEIKTIKTGEYSTARLSKK